MSNYTVLTVFENTDTINEPVIFLPLVGKTSFRQIGIIISLAIILPLIIYSGYSEYLQEIFPNPIFSINTTHGTINLTWDVVIAILPIPFGLGLGMPRPKLLAMDQMIISLIHFSIYHTSVKSVKSPVKKASSKTSSKKPGSKKKSAFEGFAKKDDTIVSAKSKNIYRVAVTEIGIPKNITITLYDLKGNPMRNRLARTYIDDILQSSITSDSDGVIGMTFVPKSKGQKCLKILVDGIDTPIVDAILDVMYH